MEKRKIADAETARFMRKKNKNDGLDEQEEQQDQNFISNPSKALNKHSMKQTQKQIEKQVEYFGNAIQPFHMRKQQELGDIDEQGFFVFSKKNKIKDAWLDSIGQADDNQAADQIAKRIKKQSRFQSVYQGNQNLTKNLKQNQEQQQQQSNQNPNQQQQQQQQQQQNNTFTKQQLLQIMIDLLPNNKNANFVMKKLKAQKNMDEYNKMLTISNQYIQKTGQYDILTLKKQLLQDMLQQIQSANRKINQQPKQQSNQQDDQIGNWDDEQQNQNNKNEQKYQEQDDNDNIF